MACEAQMQFLGESGGVRWYWAEPGLFETPGVHYWDGQDNVHVKPPASQPTSGAAGAPERIYLQINTDGDPSDTGYPADHEDVTWCWRSIGGQEVQYVRADLATPPAQQADKAAAQGLRAQHDADSAELRRLCQARDHARRERDAARAEIAGLESSVGHLSVMVDEQTRLVQKAIAIMKALHESATPIDGPDMDACIPGHAFHVFVDGHAELMHALAVGPQITTPQPSQQARQPMTDEQVGTKGGEA
jgi:hypothetical protein